jgi:hypothetical protein
MIPELVGDSFIVKPQGNQFQETIEVLKKMRSFKYDPKDKTWINSKKVYTELVSWFNYHNIKYLISLENERNIIKETFSEKQLKINRKDKFDDYILTKDTKLFTYQRDDINLAIKRNRNFLFHEPGLGKTLEAISIFSHYYFNKYIEKIFVLAELPLLYHWKKEFLLYSKMFISDDIVMIDNDNKLDFKKLLDKKVFIIAHHIAQDIVLDLINKKMIKSDGTRLKKSNLQWSKINLDLSVYFNNNQLGIIIDECHRFKNPKSVLTRSLLSFIESFEYRAMMSATPFITRFEDLYSQAILLDPGIFPLTYEAFKINISYEIGRKFKVKNANGTFREVVSPYEIVKRDPHKIEKITDVLSNYVLKRRKQDIPELKAKQIINEVYLQFPNNYRKIYDSIKDYEISVLKDDILNEDISQNFPYLIQFLDNPLLIQGKVIEKYTNIQELNKIKIDKDPKIIYLDLFLDSHINDQETKVVVYDIHPRTLDMLNDRYSKKYGSYTLHGESKYTREEKNRIIEKFNDPDSDCKVLFLSFITSSSGLNLNKACNTLLVYSMPNAPMLWKQGMDRIYRVNNLKDAYVYVLLYDNTYDIERYNSIIKRTEFNDKYMNKKLTVKEIYELLN